MNSHAMTSSAELLNARSSHQTEALDAAAIERHLAMLDGWTLEEGRIVKQYDFKNYYRTLAFVNAIAYMIHEEDHHPDLLIGYNRCTVHYHTHSVNQGKGGLSINDFICAAKVDALFRQAHAPKSA